MVHASFVQTGTFTDVNGIINIKTAVYKPLTNGLAENIFKITYVGVRHTEKLIIKEIIEIEIIKVL